MEAGRKHVDLPPRIVSATSSTLDLSPVSWYRCASAFANVPIAMRHRNRASAVSGPGALSRSASPRRRLARQPPPRTGQWRAAHVRLGGCRAVASASRAEAFASAEEAEARPSCGGEEKRRRSIRGARNSQESRVTPMAAVQNDRGVARWPRRPGRRWATTVWRKCSHCATREERSSRRTPRDLAPRTFVASRGAAPADSNQRSKSAKNAVDVAEEMKSDPATETRAQERSARRDVGRASDDERARDVHAAIRRDARDFLREDEKRKTRRIVVP